MTDEQKAKVRAEADRLGKELADNLYAWAIAAEAFSEVFEDQLKKIKESTALSPGELDIPQAFKDLLRKNDEPNN